jgi:glycosyltransferase involved in cell wall biosynthesis
MIIYKTLSVIFYMIGWLLGFYKLWNNKYLSKKTNIKKPTDYKISVIIPARNEESSLSHLLDSLSIQTLKPYEIIVVDDFSVDKTSSIAQKYKNRVINPDRLPEGWTGKNWACYSGYIKSKGDILLFLDADVILNENALEYLLNTYIREGGLISVQPKHYMKKLYEQLSIFFNLIAVMSVNAFGITKKSQKSTGAFGPVMMIGRQDYEYVNGHKAVKNKIVEDMSMGELLKKNNINTNLYLGGDIIKFRMYPSGIKQLIEGWTKNFMLGAKMLSVKYLIPVFIWIFSIIGSIDFLINTIVFKPNIIAIITGLVVYFMFVGEIYILSKKIGEFRFYTALLFPIPLSFFVYIFFRSIICNVIFGKVKWKDRQIKSS